MTEYPIGGAGGRADEGFDDPDDNDEINRQAKESRARFGERVTVTLDGFAVEVPRAVPKTDARGQEHRDHEGELVPRVTTIYDAALALVKAGRWTDGDLRARIPTMCHLPHMTPIAVCRLCMVHIAAVRRGKLTPARKLVPACQHRVEPGMVVTTRAGVEGYDPAARAGADLPFVERQARQVRSAVNILAELLVADHTAPGAPARPGNEVDELAAALGVVPRAAFRKPDRPDRNESHRTGPVARRIALPLVPAPATETERAPDAARAWEAWNREVDARFPYSSGTVVVDHEACIQCDRCARACSELRPFQVIGHTGKGYDTRISFDLDALLRDSTCVQCGECVASCPTGALAPRRRARPRAWDDTGDAVPLAPHVPFAPGSGFLSAEEMRGLWLAYDRPTRGRMVVFPFRGVPLAALKMHEGGVRRWVVPPGERRVLCSEGDAARTAFLLQGSGRLELYARVAQLARPPGLLGTLLGRRPGAGAPDGFGRLVGGVEDAALIVGEAACLQGAPRTATVVLAADPDAPALELGFDADGRPRAVARGRAGPAVVYEITRSVLRWLRLAPAAREHLEEVALSRALGSAVQRGRVFGHLAPDRRAQVIPFLLASGQLQLRLVGAGERVVAEGDRAGGFYVVRSGTLRVSRRAGGREQTIRLLADGDSFGEEVLLGDRAAVRTTSVVTLEPCELVRVPHRLFLDMCAQFPEVRDRLEAGPGGAPAARDRLPAVFEEYVRHDLHQGQNLLALDLTECTRCDECAKACADSHDGHSRLLREGPRFGDFLVATACRACRAPGCLDDCPVDAIGRRGNHLEVLIESHCIGCGLCERNCPYGAIHMVARGGPGAPAGAARRAVNCDLCNGGVPYCVQACPHDAAFRLPGPALLDAVIGRATDGA